MNRRSAALTFALVSALGLTFAMATATESHATVMVTGPAPGTAVNDLFFGLDIPPVGGALDERGFSGFEYLMSGVDPAVNDFTANDMYIVQGNDTNPAQTIRTNLGGRDDLSGVPMNFSIQHNLVGGRNFTFSMENTITSMTSVLCWGLNCAAGSIASETINGEAPFAEFNGLQIQVRAQDVVGATTSVQILSLTGISDIIGDPLYNETVDPNLPGTLQTPFGTDDGRRGQWLIADSLDFLVNEWELAGVVTLSRPDGALSDRTKVRLAIDLVRDPEFPSVVPEPSTALLVGLGLAGLATRRRRAV